MTPHWAGILVDALADQNVHATAMTGHDFHDTRQGRIFYEHTLPAVIRALERMAVAMERLAPEPDGGEPDPEPSDQKDDES